MWPLSSFTVPPQDFRTDISPTDISRMDISRTDLSHTDPPSLCCAAHARFPYGHLPYGPFSYGPLPYGPLKPPGVPRYACAAHARFPYGHLPYGHLPYGHPSGVPHYVPPRKISVRTFTSVSPRKIPVWISPYATLRRADRILLGVARTWMRELIALFTRRRPTSQPCHHRYLSNSRKTLQ